MREYRYYVCILTTSQNKMFYIGITRDLAGRLLQHKKKLVPGYTSRYNVNKLVYYEEYDYVYHAIAREKQLKNWHREWKINLIKKLNPDFNDLSIDWLKNANTIF